MTIIRLVPEAWQSAHAAIAGERNAFSDLVQRSRAALTDGPVEWVFPVSSRSVYSLEAPYRVAAEEGFGFTVEIDGPLSPREQAFVDDFRRHCLGVQDDAPTETLGIGDYLAAAGEAAGALLRRIVPQRLVGTFPRTMKTVVVIGAYGGDHVGDAAILGGVLLTLNARYGTEAVTVMSHRPDHTRRLSGGLDTPVSIKVANYTPAETDRALMNADGLVLAGGPLMDLPRVLLKHLCAAYRARSLGLPFIIERVGMGPFKRQISRRLANALVSSAVQVSVRSAGSAEDPILQGKTFSIGRDPAFDYLATRERLSLLTDAERGSIDELLKDTKGRHIIGINIRPIRHSWAKQGADFARQHEEECNAALADALAEIASRLPIAPVFVFFPMNPIQFGMSDLHSAYRLQKALAGRVDLRVWQADPDVDGVLALLRRLDAVVAMRLHACIFSASQNLPLFGIDYYPGAGGKVEQLFSDLGHGDRVMRIDTFDQHWLSNALLHTLGTAPKMRENA